MTGFIPMQVLSINKIISLLISGFLLLLTTGCQADSEEKYSRARPPAIEFIEGLPWVNVSRPLTLEDLHGKVVIVDFWTYGCINCIHVLEDFRKLEHKYGNKIAIVGIHTPKFDNEKNLETLRRIVVRYGIDHPVVNDVDSLMARLYGMRAWPTQYIIDPAGKVLGKLEGEGNYNLFVEVIDKLLKEHATELDDKPLPVALEKKLFSNALLAAPGKIAVSDTQVAISDSLHHRIIITNHKGKIQKIIGGKTSGFADGSASQARFLLPQGLVFAKENLYVADTGNHSIRKINLKNGTVTTVAGNGKNEIRHSGSSRPTSIGLRSPWALALKGNDLYIAMAGIHQIWKLDLASKKISPWAGNGRESIKDGSLHRSSFSQPSGLSLSGNELYVADAEVSAVRKINIDRAQVNTLVGSGLFDFGDRDGAFKKAELQHVLGVAAYDNNHLFIADTYNHKLKVLKLKEKKVETVAGTGKPGKGSGEALESALNEPGGIVRLGDNILIADTNNNRIMKYDIKRKTLTEWIISH
jgi:thiol-disulfide isomerase/thioredoxin/DNA-binding beta-propeller fold protein YncE